MSDTEILNFVGGGTYNQWSLGPGYLYTDVPTAATTFRLGDVTGVQWPRPCNIESLRFVARVMTPGVTTSFKFRILTLGTEYDSPVFTTTSPIYTEIYWQLPQMPNNGAAWTGTRADARYTDFEAGLVFVSGDEARCEDFSVYVLHDAYPHWTVVPSGAGVHAQWQGFPASMVIPPYQRIQEFDGDLTYIESSTNGDLSTFLHDAIGAPFPANVDRFRVTALVKNLSSTPQTVTPILRLGGVDYRGGCDTIGAVVPADDIWHIIYTDYITDPSLAWPAGNPAGGAWTQAQVNAAEIGLENTSGGIIHCTSMAGEVWCMPTPISTIDLYPTANGFHTNFPPTVPGGGEAAWEDVDEEPPDNATSYIAASATTAGTAQYCSFSVDIAPIIAISSGTIHTLTVRSDGTIWGWGANNAGQLGIGTVVTPVLAPRQVISSSGIGVLEEISAVAGGGQHSVALKRDGTVWCWGLNTSGQLGRGDFVSPVAAPVQVLGPGGVGFLAGITAIAAGTNFSIALRSDGTVWCWGANGSGQLGNGGGASQNVPVQVLGVGGVGLLANIISIGGGASHAVAAMNDNTVYCWGLNGNGQLGDNTIISKPWPVQVLGVGGIGNLAGIWQVSAGTKHTAVIHLDSTVYCWGQNNTGQLGDGTGGFLDSWTPIHTVDGLGGFLSNVRSIASGIGHTASGKTDGTAWCWGLNGDGQLGDNNAPANSDIPVQVVDGVGVVTGVSAVAARGNHTVSLKSIGTVWTWGFNNAGQLGDGTIISSPIAILAIGLAIPTNARIYSVELRCRVRLAGLPHSTAKVVPLLRGPVLAPTDWVGKPITIESTGGTWFDVKWDYFSNPGYCCPWGTFFGGPPASGLAEVRDDYEWGIGVIEGAVYLSRLRVKIGTCRDYAAAPPPLPTSAQITNSALAFIARSALDGTLYAVTEFSVGIGGYDLANPGTVTPINPADVALSSEVWRGPLTHLQYSVAPPPETVQYWCRVPRGATSAVQGIGEVGLWAKILWSPFVWEIGTFFLFAIQHQPCQVKHEDSVHEYVLAVTYP
jgi:alpha-tubulin suppressor-like RCC1 family protein